MKSYKLQDVRALQNITEIYVFILTIKQNGNPRPFSKKQTEYTSTAKVKQYKTINFCSESTS